MSSSSSSSSSSTSAFHAFSPEKTGQASLLRSPPKSPPGKDSAHTFAQAFFGVSPGSVCPFGSAVFSSPQPGSTHTTPGKSISPLKEEERARNFSDADKLILESFLFPLLDAALEILPTPYVADDEEVSSSSILKTSEKVTYRQSRPRCSLATTSRSPSLPPDLSKTFGRITKEHKAFLESPSETTISSAYKHFKSLENFHFLISSLKNDPHFTLELLKEFKNDQQAVIKALELCSQTAFLIHKAALKKTSSTFPQGFLKKFEDNLKQERFQEALKKAQEGTKKKVTNFKSLKDKASKTKEEQASNPESKTFKKADDDFKRFSDQQCKAEKELEELTTSFKFELTPLETVEALTYDFLQKTSFEEDSCFSNDLAALAFQAFHENHTLLGYALLNQMAAIDTFEKALSFKPKKLPKPNEELERSIAFLKEKISQARSSQAQSDFEKQLDFLCFLSKEPPISFDDFIENKSVIRSLCETLDLEIMQRLGWALEAKFSQKEALLFYILGDSQAKKISPLNRFLYFFDCLKSVSIDADLSLVQAQTLQILQEDLKAGRPSGQILSHLQEKITDNRVLLKSLGACFYQPGFQLQITKLIEILIPNFKMIDFEALSEDCFSPSEPNSLSLAYLSALTIKDEEWESFLGQDLFASLFSEDPSLKQTLLTLPLEERRLETCGLLRRKEKKEVEKPQDIAKKRFQDLFAFCLHDPTRIDLIGTVFKLLSPYRGLPKPQDLQATKVIPLTLLNRIDPALFMEVNNWQEVQASYCKDSAYNPKDPRFTFTSAFEQFSSASRSYFLDEIEESLRETPVFKEADLLRLWMEGFKKAFQEKSDSPQDQMTIFSRTKNRLQALSASEKKSRLTREFQQLFEDDSLVSSSLPEDQKLMAQKKFFDKVDSLTLSLPESTTSSFISSKAKIRFKDLTELSFAHLQERLPRLYKMHLVHLHAVNALYDNCLSKIRGLEISPQDKEVLRKKIDSFFNLFFRSAFHLESQRPPLGDKALTEEELKLQQELLSISAGVDPTLELAVTERAHTLIAPGLFDLLKHKKLLNDCFTKIFGVSFDTSLLDESKTFEPSQAFLKGDYATQVGLLTQDITVLVKTHFVSSFDLDLLKKHLYNTLAKSLSYIFHAQHLEANAIAKTPAYVNSFIDSLFEARFSSFVVGIDHKSYTVLDMEESLESSFEAIDKHLKHKLQTEEDPIFDLLKAISKEKKPPAYTYALYKARLGVIDSMMASFKSGEGPLKKEKIESFFHNHMAFYLWHVADDISKKYKALTRLTEKTLHQKFEQQCLLESLIGLTKALEKHGVISAPSNVTFKSLDEVIQTLLNQLQSSLHVPSSSRVVPEAVEDSPEDLLTEHPPVVLRRSPTRRNLTQSFSFLGSGSSSPKVSDLSRGGLSSSRGSLITSDSSESLSPSPMTLGVLPLDRGSGSPPAMFTIVPLSDSK